MILSLSLKDFFNCLLLFKGTFTIISRKINWRILWFYLTLVSCTVCRADSVYILIYRGYIMIHLTAIDLNNNTYITLFEGPIFLRVTIIHSLSCLAIYWNVENLLTFSKICNYCFINCMLSNAFLDCLSHVRSKPNILHQEGI